MTTFKVLLWIRSLPGPEQPRDVFDAGSTGGVGAFDQDKRAAPADHGTAHVDGKYRIIAGERRWRAAKMAGLQRNSGLGANSGGVTSPGTWRSLKTFSAKTWIRMEIAAAFDRLATEHGMSHEQIAERTGKDRSTVTNFLRLLRLGDEVKEALKNGSDQHGPCPHAA